MTTTIPTNSEASLSEAPEHLWLEGLAVATAGESAAVRIAGRVLAQFGALVHDLSTLRDDAAPAWEQIDIVLTDRVQSPCALPCGAGGSAADHLAYATAHNRSVWVTLSAYGLSSDRADRFASNMTLLAAGGILGHSRIGEDQPPTVPAGSLGLNLAGHVMAAAALHGLHARRTEGHPVHVDVSAQAAIISTGLTLEMAHALSNCPDQGGSSRYGAPTGFFDCADGAIYVVVLEQHQWAGFQKALAPALDGIATLEEARNRSAEVNSTLEQWLSTRTAAETEQVLQSFGVPCTRVNTASEFIARSRSAGRPFDVNGAGARALPGLVETVGGKHSDHGAAGAIPLGSLRILDAGHVLAVPLAGAWLGAMGARVTKLEDPKRLDVYRRRGPFADGVPGLNRSAYFNHINFCKETLDVTTGHGEDTVDLASFDVVLNNLSRHRAERLGVDGESVFADTSARLVIASSGFGRAGAWSEYRAYGHNIHAFAGLVAASRDARGRMADVGTPWADPLSSVGIATWVLAWSLADDHTSSTSVDFSMAELICAQIADVADPDSTDVPSSANEIREFFLRIPGSDRLLAVTLNDASEAQRFELTVGYDLPKLLTTTELVDLPWQSAPDADTLERALLAAGLSVSLVHTAHDLADDQFVRSTGLYQPVKSPTLGEYEVTGLPWVLSDAARPILKAAPERPGSESI
ncbi:CoA transferase [Gordonia jinghuaiqii]|uniref:CoA transferase n=1 Tax=Gordonia jinghuaiqii TaxID=2758710 RepID=A0A7D7LQQ8_9ACTN|nr:CoA transferase [Gordonia jinghuaiqii]QMT00983.1 CoA transferase [Gordonia jinghuaiqii]